MIPDTGDSPRTAGPTSAQVATALAAAGGALVVVTSAVGGSGPWVVPFVLWGLVPWALLWLAGRGLSDPWIPGGAGAAALAVELGVRAAVFLFPAGSTAAIALIFSPVMVTLALLVGGLVGYVLGRFWVRGGLVIKIGVAVVSAVILGLAVLGLATPDLFPTTVLSRRAAWQEIGPARVVAGGESFETVVLSERSAWVAASDLDGEPGDEIAVLGHRQAELFELPGLEPGGTIEFDWDDRSPLSWFSTLLRLDGRLVVLQGGGGYSETELVDLTGNRLWLYRPDPKLPPTALRAADLDRDGAPELYAAHHQAIVRLDGTGQELWSRPARMASLVELLPRDGKAGAWVVAFEMGWTIRVWDENGEEVAALRVPQEQWLRDVVAWPDERSFVLADEQNAWLIGQDGMSRFELELDGLRFEQAVAVRFAPGAPADLALLTVARRDVERWRLRLLSPERETLYEEVFDQPVRLRTATAGDGSQVLLVSGGGLRALRLRRAPGEPG